MHSETGMEMIKHFLCTISGLKGDWTMDQVVEVQMKSIADQVGPTSDCKCMSAWGVVCVWRWGHRARCCRRRGVTVRAYALALLLGQ